MRLAPNVVPLLALFLFAFGLPALGQNPNLFETQPAATHAGHNDAPLTDAQKAAGEKESIF
jgi:hypothetical protein